MSRKNSNQNPDLQGKQKDTSIMSGRSPSGSKSMLHEGRCRKQRRVQKEDFVGEAPLQCETKENQNDISERITS